MEQIIYYTTLFLFASSMMLSLINLICFGLTKLNIKSILQDKNVPSYVCEIYMKHDIIPPNIESIKYKIISDFYSMISDISKILSNSESIDNIDKHSNTIILNQMLSFRVRFDLFNSTVGEFDSETVKEHKELYKSVLDRLFIITYLLGQKDADNSKIEELINSDADRIQCRSDIIGVLDEKLQQSSTESMDKMIRIIGAIYGESTKDFIVISIKKLEALSKYAQGFDEYGYIADENKVREYYHDQLEIRDSMLNIGKHVFDKNSNEITTEN